MGPIEKAICQFQAKQREVYRADPDRLTRDTRTADRAVADHTGRWLLEVLQNSEDAGATNVEIVIDANTLYIADDGRGLRPSSVKAISGTDLSDKGKGTIGRKGVGFKSVYQLTDNPQVLTVGGEGIEFCPRRARQWLIDNDLPHERVPFQWIPFPLAWHDATERDQALRQFSNYRTVIRCPLKPGLAEQEVGPRLSNWPPHTLLCFRNLKTIVFPDFEVALGGPEDRPQLRDSRQQEPTTWRVLRETITAPPELLASLPGDERRAIEATGVSFLVAAPLAGDRVHPLPQHLPIHVFYPTEELSPVPLLLHAEFLVKGDRTAILPIEDASFNGWVAEQLAERVCRFVNKAFHPEAPADHVALLAPRLARNASRPVGLALWQRIRACAGKRLRLADADGRRRLSLRRATLLSLSVSPGLAREVLRVTPMAANLLHESFDTHGKARSALRELGCQQIDDEQLFESIAITAPHRPGDSAWLWVCWQWLADWLAENPYDSKRRCRLADLPIIPANGIVASAHHLANRIVTWRPDDDALVCPDLPDWLPLLFIDDWLASRFRENTELRLSNLQSALHVDPPDANVIQRATATAIEEFLSEPQGNPTRFLAFVLRQSWHDQPMADERLAKCPVPLARPCNGRDWAPACHAYFGQDWGNDLLQRLYEGNHDVPWVGSLTGHTDRERAVLVWLGCTDAPRVVADRGPDGCGYGKWALPHECREWARVEFSDTDHRCVDVAEIARLEHIDMPALSASHTALLLRILALRWREYYEQHELTSVCWYHRRYNRKHVPSFWWWQVRNVLRPRLTDGSQADRLADCWLPDRETERAIGPLLPVIDLAVLADDKDVVREWLLDTVGLRRKIEQLRPAEWVAIVHDRIPRLAPPSRLAGDKGLRRDVRRWYEVCLEAARSETWRYKELRGCRLACVRGQEWDYVTSGARYMDDDRDAVEAFGTHLWLFHVKQNQRRIAREVFGLRSLAESVERHVHPAEPVRDLPDEWMRRWEAVLPYVYALCANRKQGGRDDLRRRMAQLQIRLASNVRVELRLDGRSYEMDRGVAVEKNTIYVRELPLDAMRLGQALEEVFGGDADVYENLVRCGDDEERRRKLQAKGIPDPEIEQYLIEYAEDDSPSARAGTQPPAGAVGAASPPTRAPSCPGGVSVPCESVPEVEEAAPHRGPGRLAGAPSGPGPASVPVPRRPLGVSAHQRSDVGHDADRPDASEPRADGIAGRSPGRSLRHPDKDDYSLCAAASAQVARLRRPSAQAATAARGPAEARRLTDEERSHVERAGRCFARRALEAEGYRVEEMPADHPGFDLRATREGEELRVEIKAHTGSALLVELTKPQWEAYEAGAGGAYRWELWNVEYLDAASTEPVRITRYNEIPVSALHVQRFRIDLRRCGFTAAP